MACSHRVRRTVTPGAWGGLYMPKRTSVSSQSAAATPDTSRPHGCSFERGRVTVTNQQHSIQRSFKGEHRPNNSLPAVDLQSSDLTIPITGPSLYSVQNNQTACQICHKSPKGIHLDRKGPQPTPDLLDWELINPLLAPPPEWQRVQLQKKKKKHLSST